MILGIGADDVFILYDAWLQSEHVEGIKESKSQRFVWAYRRSAMAMPLGVKTDWGFEVRAGEKEWSIENLCRTFVEPGHNDQPSSLGGHRTSSVWDGLVALLLSKNSFHRALWFK